jgi:tetratricopeptide (TPR) repeat protein
MAEGEFALVKDYLDVASKKPLTTQGMPVNDTVLNFMLADSAVLQRDEAALRQYAPLAEETAVRDGHKLFQGSAQRALGVLHRLTGDYVQAEHNLLQALRIFEVLETKWQLGRTLVELAELATARTDYAQARDYYVRALESFTEMGAKPDMERTQNALNSLPAG